MEEALKAGRALKARGMHRMRYKPGKCHGFTVVELLVTLSLTAMVIATLGSFFLNHLRSYRQSVDDINLQDQVKTAMNLFMEKAMETKGITAISPIGDIPYLVTLRKNDGTSLIFSYNSTSYQLKWGIDAATNIVTGKVSEFIVNPRRNDGTSVDEGQLSQASMADVKITVSGTDSGIPGPPKEVTLDNSLRFRNYVISP